jgi:hypothetical protein
VGNAHTTGLMAELPHQNYIVNNVDNTVIRFNICCHNSGIFHLKTIRAINPDG